MTFLAIFVAVFAVVFIFLQLRRFQSGHGRRPATEGEVCDSAAIPGCNM
jgi:hypothetical protein